MLLPLLATIKKGIGIYTVAKMASRRIKNSILLAEQRNALLTQRSPQATVGAEGLSSLLGTIKGGLVTPPRSGAASPLASTRALGAGAGLSSAIGLGTLSGLPSAAVSPLASVAGPNAAALGTAAALKGMGTSTARLTGQKLDAAAIVNLMKTFADKRKTSSQSAAVSTHHQSRGWGRNERSI